MAEQKRNTIFPGCDQWTSKNEIHLASTNTRRSDRIVSKIPEPTAPEQQLLKTSEGRQKTPRIKLPIKPLSAYKADPIPVHQHSPWSSYERGYKLQLGGSVAVVRTIPTTSDLFTIRSFSSDSADKKLYMLRQFQHENILAAYETFIFQDAFYVISEHAEISCNELIIARPDEIQLVAIIHQVS